MYNLNLQNVLKWNINKTKWRNKNKVEIPSNCHICLSTASARLPLLLQILHERCDRMRPALFRLASETMDDDSALTQILDANDKLTHVVNAFKEQVGRNCGRERSQSEEETAVKINGTVIPRRTPRPRGQFCFGWSCFFFLPQLRGVPERLKATTSSTCQRWTHRRCAENPSRQHPAFFLWWKMTWILTDSVVQPSRTVCLSSSHWWTCILN